MTRPDSFSWTISALLHGELAFFLALAIGGEEVEVRFPEDPDLHCALVERPLPVAMEPAGDRFGRWPMNCDHPELRKLVRSAPDWMEADTRCEVCGWPWWVLRATSWDERGR